MRRVHSNSAAGEVVGLVVARFDSTSALVTLISMDQLLGMLGDSELLGDSNTESPEVFRST